MTVREYIEYLKTLDQDRGIWVAYDFPCAMFKPIPDERAEAIHVNTFGGGSTKRDIGVKEGDYIIAAGWLAIIK